MTNSKSLILCSMSIKMFLFFFFDWFMYVITSVAMLRYDYFPAISNY